MKKNRNRNVRKLTAEERKRHAKKWLFTNRIKELVSSYSKKYGVSMSIAHYELLELGYKDEIAIQYYEKDGVEWEYKYDGYTGEMHVVPVGTEDWELCDF